MKTAIRYTVGALSLLLIAATVCGLLFMRSYRKNILPGDEHDAQDILGIVTAEDETAYYEYGYLAKNGAESHRCGYISKYDKNGKLIKTSRIRESSAPNSYTGIGFLCENDGVLIACASTTFPNTGTQTGSLVKLDKDDLSIISKTELGGSLTGMWLFDADDSGLWFSNLHNITDDIMRFTKTDFEGNIISTAEVLDQMYLEYLDYDDVLNSHPEANGIYTKGRFSVYDIKTDREKIYICGTIFNENAYRCKYSGIVICLDYAGNVVWREQKTPMYFTGQIEEGISQYKGIYIDDEKIFVVGSQGKYIADGEYPAKDKGTMMTPVVDEYDLNGNYIRSHLFENKNKASCFNKILKMQDGFLLLGWPLSEETMGGQSVYQKRELNETKIEIFIGEANLTVKAFGDKLIGYVTDYSSLSPASKLFNNYQQLLQMNHLISFLRWVELFRTGIFVFLGIIAVLCFFRL